MRSWADYNNAGYLSAELVKEKPRIALYGCFQVGKSTLINCLMNRYVALTGKGLATTSLTARYRYGNKSLQYRRADGGLSDITTKQLHDISDLNSMTSDKRFFNLEAHEPAEILNLCDMIDTPGFQANSTDTDTALGILESVNYCLFVMPNRGLWEEEKNLLKRLSESGIPVSVIMNCSDGRGDVKWLPAHSLNQEILAENQAAITSAGIRTLSLGGEQIFICNALFYWSQQADFDKSKVYIDRGDTVKKHIRNLLDEEDEETSAENILTLSRIPKLVECLKARIAKYNPITHEWGD